MSSPDAEYPLPAGVQDAILNRGQLARALEISEPTLDRWIADGLPVHQQGGNGRSYEFRLSDCWAWKCRRDRDDAARTEEAEKSVRQMRLSLVGGAGGDSERALSPKERAELYEAEYKFMQAARARGELVELKAVEELFEEVMSIVRDAVTALPDRLQRECNLNNRQVEKAVTACDDALTEAARRVERGVKGDASGQANGHELELN